MSQSPPPPVPVKDRSSLQRPISAVHVPQDGAPFELVQDSNSSVHNGSAFTERTPLITPPPTIWTKFNSRFKYGQYILVGAGLLGVFVIMFIVLGTLHVFKNQRYRDELGMTSVGSTKYKGDSWGTATEGHFDMGGTGDGTYYDPGVGVTACGGFFTAQDSIVALNYVDFGTTPNPNEAPVCGACIIVTGPLGSTKATIQDECPGCERGSLDLSPEVFSKVGDFVEGRINVNWTHC